MRYFIGVTTADELKLAYRSFCLRMHPDLGGDEEEFKAMKAEYDELSLKLPTGEPAAKPRDMGEPIGKTRVTMAKLVERLVQVFMDAALRAEYLEEGDTSVSYGWDGSVLSPLTRMAYIRKFGLDTLTQAEQLARLRVQEFEALYAKSHHATYVQEARLHEQQGCAAPKAGAFVYGVHSGLKDCNGISDEFDAYASNPEWFGEAVQTDEVSDERELDQLHSSKREPLYKVCEVFEVSAEEFADNATASRLVMEAREKGEDFAGGGRCDDPDLQDPNDEYRYWYVMTAAVVCKATGRWYLIDSEGYDYARYVILPRNFREMYAQEIAEAQAKREAYLAERARQEAEEKAARFAEYLAKCKKYEGKMEDIRPLYDAVGEARRMEHEASKAHGYRNAEYKAAGKVSRAKEAALTAAQKRNVIAMATTMFPGLKCKATKAHRYCSGYDLTYIDGPKMDDFLQRTDYELFSEYWEEYRMDDCTEYHREEFTDFAEKYAASGHYGVDVKREWSDETKERLTAAVLKAVPACDGCCWENRYQWTEDDLKLVAEEVGIGYTDLSFAYERKKTFFNYIDAETMAEWCFEMMDFYGDTNQTPNPNPNDNPNDNQNQNLKEDKTMANKKSSKNESVNKSAAQFSVITYTTKKGGTAPQIIGFTGEDDPRWKAVKESGVKWASASYRKDISGEKVYLLMFGTKYMQAAQQLCDAYNSGDAKQIAEAQAACQAIYEQAQAEGKARWEAKKAEWAAKKSSKVQDVQGVQAPQPSAVSPQTSEEKTYTASEVAELLRRIKEGDAKAMEQVNELMAA